MKIAVTGATGFLGHYVVRRLVEAGHQLKCWFRNEASCSPLDSYSANIDWIQGDLTDARAAEQLVVDCEAIVHAALWRTGSQFRGGEGDVAEFARVNILGTLQLIEASIRACVKRFVFVSTCAVHEKILEDRKVDETHPLWPLSHYGAHKAAIEKFVHSYGFGQGYSICSVRPTGIYGLAHPANQSKWHSLIKRIARGQDVSVRGGGKEVHASDVAKAIELLLLTSSDVAGQAYACYDRYVSQFEVASIAKELSGSRIQISGQQTFPKHEIVTEKIRALGMNFGGTQLLRQTIGQLLNA